ncbi:protein-methionine-sulfoxide reductase heme-binding subunit MsrQ [Thalassotalea mangrovi]|uniref:Protein-methionine-sulfoxide reductase heme-binding subunit MsrQ n=1 Tax=Thalassotalea mangrovi TaxID=2572245 RepID=A0A4U1BBG0_9GAMM|nr:protein-methionine-sulfoxide reductase heme-binding subunit MsrQ [Thalassotalea mangrovi]TKB47508.1 protein-methionine-sulfoxide reductase heme-binding subunit MsrQ [Thalassotalea mangrovi]
MMTRRPSRAALIAAKICIHLTALSWVGYYYFLAITDQLGSDPVKGIIHFTGMSALNMLLLTLAVSPLARNFNLPWLLGFRRLLGLYVFFFACLHLLNFILFELQLDFSLFIDEVIERPYITLGMLAFVILTALAITSFRHLKRKMGRHWQTLHNLIYAAVILVVIHFYWSVKSDITEPVIYILLIIGLLLFRRQKLSYYLRRKVARISQQ